MSNKIFILEIDIPKGNEQAILSALLWNTDIEGIEEKEEGIIVYALQENILKESSALFQNYSHRYKQIASENWNSSWEKNYEDIYIDKLLHIRAPHHKIDTEIRLEITIQPKMSFGTGHHSTTYLMGKNMFEIDFVGKSVLDMGTGTAILAIIAEKLNANRIVAVDNDPICIENAKENIAFNHCNRIIVQDSKEFKGDDIFDVILANIHEHYLVENVALLAKMLSNKGLILVSGFLEGDIPYIKSIYEKYFHCIKEEIKVSNEHWSFLMFEKI